MNEIKKVYNPGIKKVGDNWFIIGYNKSCIKYLKDYLSLFNTEDYYILKASNNQRVISVDEFLEFNNVSYILFKKDKYDLQHIENWLEYVIDMGGIMYINKPLPPFSPNKIIIK